MKRILLTAIAILLVVMDASAVLKEKDIDNTLKILRVELTNYNRELSQQIEAKKESRHVMARELMGAINKSNQNALMLYSQKQDYVFDLTYACHQATEQFRNFKRDEAPFRLFIDKTKEEITRYDSLVVSLKEMNTEGLSDSTKINRNVCLTLATHIRNVLQDNKSNMQDFEMYYNMTEKHLKGLNDYAQKRYVEIQTNIFVNGGDSYFEILKRFNHQLSQTEESISEKYQVHKHVDSQWDSRIIFGLFFMLLIYGLLAAGANTLFYHKILPKRFQGDEFKKKKVCITMASSTVTFAIFIGVFRAVTNHNFMIMAINLLVEYAWLLSVILFSLLLRVKGDQIKNAFKIYSPLMFVGFLVIAFRIILIPNELVNLIFPPILLLCAIWQWWVIQRNNKNVPRSDIFYSFMSQVIFIVSMVCSWVGYTLMAVQILIWWIMQLACILTITCAHTWIKLYSRKRGYDKKPLSETWLFSIVEDVLLPVAGVVSVMLSVYWAADVFNLSDLCWMIFKKPYIDFPNLQISIIKLSMVVVLWYVFSYINRTTLGLMRIHFIKKDALTAASKEVMSKNVIQVLLWGIWLLFSLSILHISVTWLIAISGGLSTGIGFASKDIIENIYYGASLMTGRMKVGDWIQVDGTMGKVTSISYTSTLIESQFGEMIAFQNSQLFTKNYKNMTRNHGYVLAVVPYGVAYGSNLKEVMGWVDSAVNDKKIEWLEPKKKAKSIVAELGDNSVNLKMFVWVDAVKKSYVVSDVITTIYDTLNQHGIEIPYPQRDVHLIQNDAS